MRNNVTETDGPIGNKLLNIFTIRPSSVTWTFVSHSSSIILSTRANKGTFTSLKKYSISELQRNMIYE